MVLWNQNKSVMLVYPTMQVVINKKIVDFCNVAQISNKSREVNARLN